MPVIPLAIGAATIVAGEGSFFGGFFSIIGPLILGFAAGRVTSNQAHGELYQRARDLEYQMQESIRTLENALAEETRGLIRPVLRRAETTQNRLSTQVTQIENQNTQMTQTHEALTEEIQALRQNNQTASEVTNTLLALLDLSRSGRSLSQQDYIYLGEGLGFIHDEIASRDHVFRGVQIVWRQTQRQYEGSLQRLQVGLIEAERTPEREQIRNLELALAESRRQHAHALRIAAAYAASLQVARLQLNLGDTSPVDALEQTEGVEHDARRNTPGNP